MRARVVGALLQVYGRAQETGLLDRPAARRAFESGYLAYKLLIEAGPVWRLRPFVTPRSTVIDVGANIGFFSLRFARWVGPDGHVIAIEPEEHNIETLLRRVTRAGLGAAVECVPAAAADRAGELRLARNPAHPGDHRLSAEGEPIRAVTVDDLTAGDSRPVSLVKIDVQGAEMMVLSGARRTLAANRPVLFVEVDDEALVQFGSSAEELSRTVLDLGYTAHMLTRKGPSPPQPLEAVVANSAGGAYSDVLFLPK